MYLGARPVYDLLFYRIRKIIKVGAVAGNADHHSRVFPRVVHGVQERIVI